VIDHQQAASPQLLAESTDALLGTGQVLKDAQAEHHVELSWLEGELEQIRLDDPMARCDRKVRAVHIDGVGHVHRHDLGALAKEDFGESAGATARFEHGKTTKVVPLLAECAGRSVPAQRQSRVRIELRPRELPPLKTEGLRVGRSFHWRSHSAPRGCGLSRRRVRPRLRRVLLRLEDSATLATPAHRRLP